MDQPSHVVNDDTIARLHSMTAQLNERLTEAQDVRTRLTRAHDSNVWPDLRLASQWLTDANRNR